MKYDLKSIENLLRTNCPLNEYILNNERRMYVFTGTDCKKVLSEKYNDNEIKEIMTDLIKREIIVKCTFSKFNKKAVTINLSKTFSVNDNYMFVNDDYSFLHIILSVCIIIIVLLLVMFQVWPRNLRNKASLFVYPVLCFFVVLGVLAVLRLIVFVGSFVFCERAFWLFPNLFADVGFVDSFVPWWAYHGEDVRPVRKEE